MQMHKLWPCWAFIFQGFALRRTSVRCQACRMIPNCSQRAFRAENVSQAGATTGLRGRRSGLVRHVFRLLAKSRTPWLPMENVPFLLRLDGGSGMSYLVNSLERLGYQWAYRVVDTRSFGLPQRRERVFILASNVEYPDQYLFERDCQVVTTQDDRALAKGFYWTEGNRGLGWAVDAVPTIKGGSGLGNSVRSGDLVSGRPISNTRHPQCGTVARFSCELDTVGGERREANIPLDARRQCGVGPSL